MKKILFINDTEKAEKLLIVAILVCCTIQMVAHKVTCLLKIATFGGKKKNIETGISTTRLFILSMLGVLCFFAAMTLVMHFVLNPHK